MIPDLWQASLGRHPWNAGEIKRHPEVDTLLVTRDNRTVVMEKALSWLTEGTN